MQMVREVRSGHVTETAPSHEGLSAPFVIGRSYSTASCVTKPWNLIELKVEGQHTNVEVASASRISDVRMTREGSQYRMEYVNPKFVQEIFLRVTCFHQTALPQGSQPLTGYKPQMRNAGHKL